MDDELAQDPLPFPQGIDIPIQVTPHLTVDSVVHLESALEFWPVPTAVEGKVAYIIDLCKNPPACLTSGEKTVNAFIKQEVSQHFVL